MQIRVIHGYFSGQKLGDMSFLVGAGPQRNADNYRSNGLSLRQVILYPLRLRVKCVSMIPPRHTQSVTARPMAITTATIQN